MCALYARVAGNGFVGLDDEAYITRNPYVRDGLGWSHVAWAFASSREGNWHPLTWLSHMLDVQIFGLDPCGHHLTSVALHAGNAVLLLLLLHRMTRAPWASVLAAALFAVHPLRVESVAWAAERKDVLSGTFWMLCLLAYAFYAERPGPGGYLTVLALFALGLMAKPMLVTLPFVLLLMDLWPLGRWRPARFDSAGGLRAPPRTLRRLVLEKLPLIGLSAVSCVVTMSFQVRSRAVGPAARTANALVAYAMYLGKTIWPTGLAVLYPHPALVSHDLASSLMVPAIGAGALLVIASWLVVRAAPRRPYLLVGWLWYLGTLVPVIGLVQVGMQSRADRYTYLPLIGIYVLVAWSARDLAIRFPSTRFPLAAAAASTLVACASVTWVQIGYWKNGATLYERALQVTAANYVAHNNLGVVLEDQGRPDEARAHFEAALSTEPRYAEAHNNLASVLEKQGDLARARVEYEAALRIVPDLSQAYDGLASISQRQGDLPRAAAEFEAAIRLRPDDARLHNDQGVVLAKLGDYSRARACFESAIELDPALVDAHNNLATIAMREGDLAAAVTHYEIALRVKPDYFEARYNLALALRKRGDLARAASNLEDALRLRPDDARAHRDLASILLDQGDLARAEAHCREALRLDPRLPGARETLEGIRPSGKTPR